ncbi:MAG: alpha/beta hydrolase fold domain-containing protein [Porphyrobacter sp.]|nr:alpha/beta hydrolase fold domain-containing protein [Porphyrobacter sp.]
MLTDNPCELRSDTPSLVMRAVKWLMARRPPVFPHDAQGFAAAMANRRLPADAPLPASFRRDFLVGEWEAAGHPVVTIHPKSGPTDWHMLYFHGGGFVQPMFKVHWPLVGAMVKYCGISVSVPLYPVVPESPHAQQDAVADAAWETLAEHHDPAKIILNGDSAGGHMALALALRLAKRGGAVPGKLALFAPWLDLTLADPEIAAVEPHDLMLKIGTLRACGALVAGERDPGSATLSPLYAASEDLARLPPTRIWTGRHDLFIVDSRTFAGRLRAAGVDARLYEYEAAPHVFMAITPTREAKDVFALLGEFLAA